MNRVSYQREGGRTGWFDMDAARNLGQSTITDDMDEALSSKTLWRTKKGHYILQSTEYSRMLDGPKEVDTFSDFADDPVVWLLNRGLPIPEEDEFQQSLDEMEV